MQEHIPFSYYFPQTGYISSLATHRWTGFNDRSGVGVPNFREILKSGGDCGSNYSRLTREVVSNSPGFTLVIDRLNGSNPPLYRIASGSGCLILGGMSIYDPASLIPNRVGNAALGEFVARLNRKLHQIQSGVVAAEAKKTWQSIKRPASAIRDAVNEHHHNVKKQCEQMFKRRGGKWVRYSPSKKRDKLLRLVQGTHLEFQFGVKPLIGDTIDAAKAAARIIERAHPPERVFAEANWDQRGGGGFEDASDAGGYLAASSYAARVKRSYFFKGRIRYTGGVKVEFLGDPSRILGLDYPSFIPSLWEWLPYSWLVDYFVNVQDILTSLTFPRSSVQYAYRSTLAEGYEIHRSFGVYSQSANYSPYLEYEVPSELVLKTFSYSRVKQNAYSDLVVPISLGFPTGTKLFNVLGVLAQRNSAISFIKRCLSR